VVNNPNVNSNIAIKTCMIEKEPDESTNSLVEFMRLERKAIIYLSLPV